MYLCVYSITVQSKGILHVRGFVFKFLYSVLCELCIAYVILFCKVINPSQGKVLCAKYGNCVITVLALNNTFLSLQASSLPPPHLVTFFPCLYPTVHVLQAA